MKELKDRYVAEVMHTLGRTMTVIIVWSCNDFQVYQFMKCMKLWLRGKKH